MNSVLEYKKQSMMYCKNLKLKIPATIMAH